MLIEFRVKNFRSYHEPQTLSMVASTATEHLESTISAKGLGDLRLVRAAGIYGKNASGKSNLMKAAVFMRSFAQQSADERQAGDGILAQPFLLDSASRKKPCEFELTFILQGVRYQYGFSVRADRVEEEWLIAYPHNLPQKWFERRSTKGNKVQLKFSSKLKGSHRKLAGLTRPNALFLSVAAKWNHPAVSPVFHWITKGFNITLPGNPLLKRFTTERCNSDAGFRKWVVESLNSADIGINDVRVRTLNVQKVIASPTIPLEFKIFVSETAKLGEIRDVQTVHLVRGTTEEALFDLSDESDGTQQFFSLLGPLHDTLHNGTVLLVDEIDASLHPHLVRKVVEFFQSPKLNPKGAQLIFTTHDTTLLSTQFLRRDQIWLTDKDHTGATRLYSIQEFHPRKDESLQKGYLGGRYGGVPVMGEFAL